MEGVRDAHCVLVHGMGVGAALHALQYMPMTNDNILMKARHVRAQLAKGR